MLLTYTISGVVLTITRSSAHSSFTGLVKYFNGGYTYIRLPHNVWIGSLILTMPFFSSELIRRVYWRLDLHELLFKTIITYVEFFKPGMLISSVCLSILKGSQYARSAGTFCKILEIKDLKELVYIELPTTKPMWISFLCLGINGRMSNIAHKREVYGKAGYNRRLNIRPSVRGVAMNPVDHPHGGRTKSNSPEVTPWGKIAKHSH